MASVEAVSHCPFCGFEDTDAVFTQQHINLIHPEDEYAPSPIEAGQEPPAEHPPPESMTDWIECPCGESCMISQIQQHIDLHEAEDAGLDSIDIEQAAHEDFSDLDDHDISSSDMQSLAFQRHPSSRVEALTPNPYEWYAHSDLPSRLEQQHLPVHTDTMRSSGENLTGAGSQLQSGQKCARLGSAELGPHHKEERMPDWLRTMLEKGAKVSVVNHISRDGRLLRIEKVANEVWDILPVLAQLCEQDREVRTTYLCHPSVAYVFKMAQALFQSLSIGCVANTVSGFSQRRSEQHDDPASDRDTPAYRQLLAAVEQHFLQGASNTSQKVCKTLLAPLYLQFPGHSMTIVGFEQRRSGSCNLLVFDPSYKPSRGIYELVGRQFGARNPDQLLKAYRRGFWHLRTYGIFEILKLTTKLQPKAGRDC